MSITVILKKTRRFYVSGPRFGGLSKSFGRRLSFIDFGFSDFLKMVAELWMATKSRDLKLETWSLTFWASNIYTNWLCITELTKTAYFEFFIGGVWHTPPGCRCYSQPPGSDRVKWLCFSSSWILNSPFLLSKRASQIHKLWLIFIFCFLFTWKW